MAEVEMAAPSYHSSHAGSMGSIMHGGPRIEMVPNPDFSFPPARTHKRTPSTLPSFAFNNEDHSGLKEDNKTPPLTPDESVPATPSHRGHRRGGSELVGGDSRLGVSNAVSSSPTKAAALPIPAPSSGPPPAGRRGHAHRRSAAMSSHDVGSIMQPSEVQPRLSSSLPSTPLDHPSQTPPLDRSLSSPGVVPGVIDPFGPMLEDFTQRPPSRPRVGFSDHVEYIPRPLSTISSETESSVSTVLGHSVNNSISSMLSMSTPSPPSSRTPWSPKLSVSTTAEDESLPRARSSLETSKRVEKEGEWLKSRSGSLKRPLSESAVASLKTTFVEPDPPIHSRDEYRKKHSASHTLGFDRRRSEPSIGTSIREPSRLSAVSLQEPASYAPATAERVEMHDHEHRSSTRRIKQWAVSKISKKTKDVHKTVTASSSTSSLRPESSGSWSVPGRVPMSEPPVAETDLDAVFSNKDVSSETRRPSSPSQLRLETATPEPSQRNNTQASEFDDFSTMVDLDAALGPMKTPPLGSNKQRKELHSSRLAKDFGGPGGHYHRRTESAPALSPFESGRASTPSQSMADVFEEDEEDETADQGLRSASLRSGSGDEGASGMQSTDEDASTRASTLRWAMEDGLGIQRGEWESERPSTSYGNVSSKFSMGTERRASSVVEETIIEEAGPGEMLEIVEAHEEPRTSSLTKSSDSSETPTILAPPSGLVGLGDGQHPLTTPDTVQTSAFSSPDFARRQGSFDTSRLGTSASSMTDNRTMSSCTTGEPLRVSVDDVPSLTSSRSTMLSTMHANSSHRDFSGGRTPSASEGPVDPALTVEKRKKRGSIQSLSNLVGGSFSSKSKAAEEPRPYTAAESLPLKVPKKKEHRLKKLMFWRSKQHNKQSLQMPS